MKKLISLISAFAMMATMAVSVNAATEPTLSLEVSSTGLKAGDVVTVVCKYDGYDVTPYDDNEGAGQKATGAQIRINIPGGIGSATQGEQFLRPGVTNAAGFSTGAPQWNWDITNNQLTLASSGIDDSMSSNGTAFTITMKLNKDVTEDLVFNFASDYDQKIVYDTYVDWAISETVNKKVTNLVSATLKAPVVEDETLPQITEAAMPEAYAKYGAKYYFKGEAISLTGKTGNEYLYVTKDGDTAGTQQSVNTIGSMLGIIGADLTGSVTPVAITDDADAAFAFEIK